jgi:hypothetical protein
MRPAPISAVIFAILGALLLVAAVVLAWLGSFAFIAIASVGMFFIAGALVAQAAPPAARASAVLAVAALALIVFGLTGTPFFYLGWGLLAGAAILALLARWIGARSVRPRER